MEADVAYQLASLTDVKRNYKTPRQVPKMSLKERSIKASCRLTLLRRANPDASEINLIR